MLYIDEVYIRLAVGAKITSKMAIIKKSKNNKTHTHTRKIFKERKKEMPMTINAGNGVEKENPPKLLVET